MKKIVWSSLLLLMLIPYIGNAKVNSNNNRIVVVEIILSSSAEKITYSVFHPNDSVETVTNKDEMIFYTANIGVINPTKKKYDLDIICVDSKNNMVFKGTEKRSLLRIEEPMGKDIIKRVVQYFGLNPKPGAMVEGQLLPLVGDNDYFIKLYFEKKLIGITKFHYLIEK